MFNVNVFTYFQLLYMWFLRSNSVVSYIYSFLVPLQRIHNELNTYRSDKRYQLSINAQVMNLERLLNDTFVDPSIYPLIYITEYEIYFEMLYIGNNGTDDAEVYLSNLYVDGNPYLEGNVACYQSKNYLCINDSTGNLPTDTDFWYEMPSPDDVPLIGNNIAYLLNYSFVINIDNALYAHLGSDKINQLKALVNKYKIFGTKYLIYNNSL